jgi:hypothetical protein
MNSCKSSSCCSHKVSSVCASNACLVVGCVLGVVRLEVSLIICLFPLSSGKLERCKCSTLRKSITSIN